VELGKGLLVGRAGSWLASLIDTITKCKVILNDFRIKRDDLRNMELMIKIKMRRVASR